MGLLAPWPSLRTRDGSVLLWSLCQLRQDLRPSLLLGVWCRRHPTSGQVQHVSGVGFSSVMEQWLCCSRKSPDQYGPAAHRAPFHRERGVSSPAFLLRRLYSMGRCSAQGHLAAYVSQRQHVGESTLPLLSAAPSLWKSRTLPRMGAETASWWCCATRTALSGRSTATAMRRATWTSCSTAWMRVSMTGRGGSAPCGSPEVWRVGWG